MSKRKPVEPDLNLSAASPVGDRAEYDAAWARFRATYPEVASHGSIVYLGTDGSRHHFGDNDTRQRYAVLVSWGWAPPAPVFKRLIDGEFKTVTEEEFNRLPDEPRVTRTDADAVIYAGGPRKRFEVYKRLSRKYGLSAREIDKAIAAGRIEEDK